MSKIFDSAIQIIDLKAQQLLPLLPIDKKSATFLINDILNEDNFNEKLTKILNLLMNRIKSQTFESTNYFDELISDLICIYPSIPRNPIDFSNWIKKKLAESSESISKYKEAEFYFQKKLNEFQKHLQIAKKMVEDYELRPLNNHEESDNILQQLKNEIEINQSLRLELNSLKSFPKENYNNLNDDIQAKNAKINSLQQKINLLQNKIAEKKSTIKTLKTKISIDSNEIDEIKKQNEELYLIHQSSSEANQSKNEKIEELIQTNQKLKMKIKKLKEKIILLRDKGNAKINKYKMKIEEQNRKTKFDSDFDSMNDSIQKRKSIKKLQDDENLILLEKCESLSSKLEKSNKIIKKYEMEKMIASNNDNSQKFDFKQYDEISSQNKKTRNTNQFNNEINKDFDEIDNNEKQLFECNGCDFDVDELKGRFDNLENSIDRLRSTLVKSGK